MQPKTPKKPKKHSLAYDNQIHIYIWYYFLYFFQSSSSLSDMKKSSGLKNVGGDTGKLIVYSEPDFQGEEHTFLGLYMV